MRIPRVRREHLAAAACALLFAALWWQVETRGRVTSLDDDIDSGLHRFFVRNDFATDVMHVLSFLGSTLWLMTLLSAVGVWLILRRRGRAALAVLVIAACGAVVNPTVKLIVDRPRPSFPDRLATARGSSFPSGHASSSGGAYAALALALARRARTRRLALAAALPLAAAVGFSRMALGVHWPTDVAGGFLLVAAWTLVWWPLLR